jgi:hypothetical protein
MPDDTQFLLGRIDGKQDETLRRLDELGASYKALEARVRKLEQFKWQLIGAATLLSLLAGYLTKFLP